MDQEGANMMGVRKPSLEMPPPRPGEETKELKLKKLKRDMKVKVKKIITAHIISICLKISGGK